MAAKTFRKKKKVVSTPFDDAVVRSLLAGDEILLNGIVYTARDAAHKRLISLIDECKSLPLDLTGQIIYYCGPTPSAHGYAVGSAGPTTSARMDIYTPRLLEKTALKGMIGKGNRNSDVIDAMKKYCCVYFAAIGGAGAFIAQHIRKAEIVCFEDLGPEAIYRMEIAELPLIVAIDCRGESLYPDKAVLNV